MNIVVIPARFGSTRFPGKPLARIQGRSMIWHVYHRSLKAKRVDAVWVATDDVRIYDEVKGWGGRVMMTRPDHASGTDRVAEVAERISCDIVVNVQGDEPMMDPAVIDAVVEPLTRNPSIGIVTPITKIKKIEEIFDPSIAKVVRDAEGFALYFSRSPIPYGRDIEKFTTYKGETPEDEQMEFLEKYPFYRHIGLYAFERKTLMKFCELPKSDLENVEKLEQLRALEYGIPLLTVLVEYNGISVDHPEDILRIQKGITG